VTLRDISIALAPGTPEWPGDTPYSCGWSWRIAEGASVNVSAYTTSPHAGTHADAPLHVRDGWAAADAMPLGAFAGAARVLTVDPAPRTLEIRDLAALGDGRIERLLLRTSCSIAGGTFPAAWPVLSLGAIAALLARGLRLLGVDAPSVDERESKSLPVHQALFAGSAYILENLDLRDAADGAYDLIALPVKLAGLDAAPVRAALRPLT
jgi:arylformamidase